MYEIRVTSRFKKDLKAAQEQGRDLTLLHAVITKLSNGEMLAPKYRDHALTGDWADFRECHIIPDWLLIYKQDKAILILTLVRNGTHSDLFR